MTEVLDLDALLDQRLERMLQEVDEAKAHPRGFLRHTQATDARTGEVFSFDFSEDSGWKWQGEVFDEFLAHEITLVLKARQLGISWCAIGYLLWSAVTTPGTNALVVSINEQEASVLVNRAWDLWESLPEHLQFEAKVLKPYKGRPSTRIELEFPDGQVSTILAMPSTPKAGHGYVAKIVLLDEHARHAYDADGWKAFIPVVADGGQIVSVSTANGIGGTFYDLYTNSEERNVHTIFLPWNLHPGRDEDWYDRIARTLPEHDRAEQYPLTPADAFMGTAGCWFDMDALTWYGQHPRMPKYHMRFVVDVTGRSAIRQQIGDKQGIVAVWDEPEEGHAYAISTDIATGRGQDYSCAHVIDLTNGNIAAVMHAKIDPDLWAEQLHFLGRWYFTAVIAVEMGGGYGEPVVLSLRDGRKGRKPYPKLYRHRIEDRPDRHQHLTYGFPMTTKTRPQVINQLEQWIRDKHLPHLPQQDVFECKTFVRHDVNPSPRAAEGCNDDRVMSLCIGLELYRQFGQHAHDVRKQRAKRSGYKATTVW
jgi:hypothetical protein